MNWALSRLSISLSLSFLSSAADLIMSVCISALHLLCVPVFVVCNSTMHHSSASSFFHARGEFERSACSCSYLFVHTCGRNAGPALKQLDRGRSPEGLSSTCSHFNLRWVTPLLIMTSPALRALLAQGPGFSWLKRQQRIASRLQAWGWRRGRTTAPSAPLPPLFPPSTLWPTTLKGPTSLISVCCIFSGGSERCNFNI